MNGWLNTAAVTVITEHDVTDAVIFEHPCAQWPVASQTDEQLYI